jgi:hypothetical protein
MRVLTKVRSVQKGKSSNTAHCSLEISFGIKDIGYVPLDKMLFKAVPL